MSSPKQLLSAWQRAHLARWGSFRISQKTLGFSELGGFKGYESEAAVTARPSSARVVNHQQSSSSPHFERSQDDRLGKNVFFSKSKRSLSNSYSSKGDHFLNISTFPFLSSNSRFSHFFKKKIYLFQFSCSLVSRRCQIRASSVTCSDMDLASTYIPAAPILLPEGPWTQVILQ